MVSGTASSLTSELLVDQHFAAVVHHLAVDAAVVELLRWLWHPQE